MKTILQAAKEGIINEKNVLLKDAGYIPEEKLDWVAMACAKSAANILAGCVSVNLAVASTISGEKIDIKTKQAALESSKSHKEIEKAMNESVDKLCAVVDTLKESDLDKEVTLPWGMKLTIQDAIALPISHMTYHDGQINYVQLLLGDNAFHWAE